MKRVISPLIAFALAGLALLGWIDTPRDLTTVLLWFAAAIVLHDLIVLPIYTAVSHTIWSRLPHPHAAYLRVPALISALIFVVLFPTISGFGRHSFHAISGLRPHDYFVRWLIVTAGLFAVSGLVYLSRRLMSRTAR